MESIERRTELILSIENSQIYEVREENRYLLASGELQIIHSLSENIYLISIGDFSYSLFNELAVLRNHKNQYFFPNNDGVIELIFPDQADELEIEVFEIFLQQHTTLANIKQASEFNQPQYIELNQEWSDIIEDNPRNQDVRQVSQKIKAGIIKGAEIATEGIRQGGEYLKNKITPEKVEEYKAKAQIGLFMAKVMANRAIDATSLVAQNFVTNLQNSDIRNNIQNSETYQSARELGRSSLLAASTIYEGLENAVNILRDAGNTAINEIRSSRQQGYSRPEEERHE
ncbi:unnamed protein product [Blepharisma stoltei]|uniref:Senescence domain-containing protein n=1 Tax=Blepharisma stoltei TaxID=1481888 RepID=A0AAU9JMV4_9CILI|nr:unnamed protein product [Blepharisma stoltei]